MHLKKSSGKWRPFCLGLNMLNRIFASPLPPPPLKRKPPCIDGMELVSLSCNHVFISAESVGWGWCKIAIATKWVPYITDKCGFLFMPWITDQYTFVWYTKLLNEIDTAAAKVITFSNMTTQCNIHWVPHAAPPHPEQILHAIFHMQN